MARLNRIKKENTQKKNSINWPLVINFILTLGLYVIYFAGR